jgi:peptidoglycan/LPS O-acetylase OafA/YrhL
MALPLLPVGWTLYFEMYFYALIAFSLFVAGRFWWLFCISVLILLPLTWSWNVNAATFLASRLLWEFVAGMILAGVFLGLRSRVLDMPLIAPVMFLAGAYFLAAGGPVISGQFLPERLLAAGFILVGTLSLDSLVARMRWLSVFIMLGRISYSTYLIHVALLVVMVSLLPVPETLGAEVATLATYALATSMLSYLFYRCFETPLWLSSWKASLRRSNDPA